MIKNRERSYQKKLVCSLHILNFATSKNGWVSAPLPLLYFLCPQRSWQNARYEFRTFRTSLTVHRIEGKPASSGAIQTPGLRVTGLQEHATIPSHWSDDWKPLLVGVHVVLHFTRIHPLARFSILNGELPSPSAYPSVPDLAAWRMLYVYSFVRNYWI